MPNMYIFPGLQHKNPRSCSDFFSGLLPLLLPSPGGLPVAEGVFVGDPVTQSAYGASAAPQATVITSAPPPAYQTHVVAASAAAAAAGGDGRGIAIPHQESGQHTVIVMNGPPGHQFGEWGREPQSFVCRACGFAGLTATMTVRERRGYYVGVVRGFREEKRQGRESQRV